MCGASDGQKTIGAEQSTEYKDLMTQAQSIFGSSSSVFNDLLSSLAPIVAAGPDQQGYSAPLMSALNSHVITTVGQQYKNASQSVREQQAAAGGGNQPLPGGATIGEDLSVSNAAANTTASELQQNQIDSLNVGRQNFFAAESALAGAPNVFNPATSAAEATTGAGKAASDTENQIAQQDNAWISSVTGALGGIAGDVVTGGMSNLGSGAGFFGGNAPAPTS